VTLFEASLQSPSEQGDEVIISSLAGNRNPDVQIQLYTYPEFIIFESSRENSVGTATGFGLEFDSQQGQDIFLYSKVSRPAMGSTQPPIQWVPGVFSPRVKRPGHEIIF
jgi:hypothetical protein